MPDAIAEPPAVQRTAATPQSALANFLKVESEPPPKQDATPGAAPSPDKATTTAATPAAPAPAAEEFDYTNPDPAKPPKNKQHWNGFLAARSVEFKRRDDEIANLRSEMKKLGEQASKLPADDPEKESLKKEREELSRQLWTVSRERHPDFKKRYDNEIEARKSDIERLVGGADGKKIANLVARPDYDGKKEAIKELLADVDEMDRPLVRQAWHEIEKLHSARERELNVSKEEFDQMLKEHEGKQKAQEQATVKKHRAMIDQMFDKELNGFRDKEKGLAEFQEKDGDDKWNAALKENLAEAKKALYGDGTPEGAIKAMLRNAVFDSIKADRDSLREKNKELEVQLAALTKAAPGLRLPGNPTGMPARPQMTVATTPQEAMKIWLKSGEESS